jgi:hypothetical protein
MTSVALVPLRVSLPGVPVMVQPRALLMVVDCVVVLLALSGSGSGAVAVIEPVAAGSTVVIVADAVLARLPRGQVIVGAVIVHVSWGGGCRRDGGGAGQGDGCGHAGGTSEQQR